MCLTEIKKFKPNKYGYKIFYKTVRHDGVVEYRSCIEHKKWEEPYFLNTWYTATKIGIVIYHTRPADDDVYQAGFHIYNNREDAFNSDYLYNTRKRVVCKVAYKDYITGLGDGSDSCDYSKQIVAQQMKIVKEIEG